MKNIFTVLLLLIILCLSGCRKTELKGRYENFEGIWNATELKITLHEEGRADLFYSPGDKRNITEGRLLITDYDLKIFKGLKKHDFTIIQFPFIMNKGQPNEYKIMVLDGHYLTTN